MPAGRAGRDLRLLGEKRPLKRAALPLKDPTHRFSGGAARSSGPSLRVPAAQPPGRVAPGPLSDPAPPKRRPLPSLPTRRRKPTISDGSADSKSVRVGDDEVLGRKERENPRTVLGHHDLLLDAGRGHAVAGRAVGLEGEHHAGLELDGLLHGVQPRDDRPFVQAEPQSVRELKPERLHFATEAEFLGPREQRRDLVRAHARLDAFQTAVHPLTSLLVRISLWLRRTPHRERAVVAGAVAVE